MEDQIRSDDALESTTKDLNAVTLYDPPATSRTSQATLLTLPPELLLDLFSHLPSSFVLPPLCSALLPFHRSQLYRKVTVILYQFDILQRTLQANKALCSFVESLVLRFQSGQNSSTSASIPLPRPGTLRQFMRSLPSLKTIFLTLDSNSVLKYYPLKSDFANNAQLTKLTLKSVHSPNARNFFDWEELRSERNGPALGELYEEQVEPEVYLELAKRSGGTFGLRYCTLKTTEIDVHTTPLSRINLVAFTHSVHLGRLLRTVGQPLLLTNLSLFSFNNTTTSSSLAPDFLSRFSNLTHLALGGTSLLTSPEFFDSLSLLPIKYLRLGPHSRVRVQPLIDLISEESKLTNLAKLILDNLDSEAPSKEDEEDADLDEWTVPDWTTECSKEKVEELKALAERSKIKIEGSTIRGLEILQSEAYQAALERAEHEEDEDDDGEDGVGRICRTFIMYLDLAPDHYEDLHQEVCGCQRDYDWCWRFADMMGWERKGYRNRRRNW
ncbi:uncharacterized protein JCM6883_007471 [Sporobolomyces salmoneus]|uniref:uncharacterized protein n=1 Tax=Sporobolomyces salmoneus TaxID=183962 RepID=UPI00316F4DEE